MLIYGAIENIRLFLKIFKAPNHNTIFYRSLIRWLRCTYRAYTYKRLQSVGAYGVVNTRASSYAHFAVYALKYLTYRDIVRYLSCLKHAPSHVFSVTTQRRVHTQSGTRPHQQSHRRQPQQIQPGTLSNGPTLHTAHPTARLDGLEASTTTPGRSDGPLDGPHASTEAAPPHRTSARTELKRA